MNFNPKNWSYYYEEYMGFKISESEKVWGETSKIKSWNWQLVAEDEEEDDWDEEEDDWDEEEDDWDEEEDDWDEEEDDWDEEEDDWDEEEDDWDEEEDAF